MVSSNNELRILIETVSVKQGLLSVRLFPKNFQNKSFVLLSTYVTGAMTMNHKVVCFINKAVYKNCGLSMLNSELCV
jgi:hypothetical protein